MTMQRGLAMKRLVVHLFLLAGLISPSFAASLQKEAWPVEKDCPACFHVQVRDLDLQLPIAQVHGVFSIGSNMNGVAIVPPSGEVLKCTFITERRSEDLAARLKKRNPIILEQHGIHNLKDFFTALGNDSAPPDTFIGKQRKVYGLDTATRYRSMERNGLTAFIMNNPNSLYQSIFFLVEGNDAFYYEAGGTLSDEMINVILSNAKVNKAP